MTEPIAVFGCHRSGTSVVARALGILGFDLGKVTGTHPSNPKGHFENLKLMGLSDTILQLLGGSWDTPIMLKPSFVDSPKIKYVLDGALAIIKKEFPGQIAWKDPRVSLTLPFFERLLGPIRSIICVRNPLEVCQSLAKRDSMGLDKASALWRSYTASALLNTRGKPRLIVHYERLMSNPENELWRILHFVGGEPYMEQCIREFTAFVESGLHHNHATIKDLYGVGGMDQRAVLLYTLLAQPDIEDVIQVTTPELTDAARGV